MLKTCMLILFSVAYGVCSGQIREPLSIKIEQAVSNNGGFKVYNVTLGNFNDSIICILRSPTISLNSRQGPFELAATNRDKDKEVYNPEYAILDTGVIYEAPLYLGSLLLPGHIMKFSIEIPVSKKEQSLTVEYFRMYDLHYREFEANMINGGWYKSYPLRDTTVRLPASQP
jgi:hypothetical protein